MGFVCTSHPSHPAVDVCDRCGATVCGSCAVDDRDGRVWCGPCALGTAGVRRRHAPQAAPRRVVAARRRELRAATTPEETPTPARATSDPDAATGREPDTSPWDRGQREGWTRRF